MKRFHNDFVIERMIKEESTDDRDLVYRKMLKIMNDIPQPDLAVTNDTLRKLIDYAEAELSIAKDKTYYGKFLDGLYIAQSYVDRKQKVERMY